MNSLFEKSNYESIVARIQNLTPEMTRLWGKMDAAQMMAHCNVPIEQAVGIEPFKDESNFLSKTLIKWVVLRNLKQGRFGKNLPTVPSFKIVDKKEFDIQKERLLKNVAVFYKKGQADKLGKHPAFGNFTTEQWGGLMYLHLDHHLKQFSV